MSLFLFLAADLVAVCALTFGLYLHRHRRRDLVVSYLGVNVGVLAVAASLANSTAGLGLGLGLFGVLSIIRLRSTELAQHEVAYYFSALALGLIAGLASGPAWLTLSLMALVLLVMFVGDHPRMLPAHRHQTVVLDRAYADEDELRERLGELLGTGVQTVTVQELDLVNDRTRVEVRYAIRPGTAQTTRNQGTPTEGIPTPVPEAWAVPAREHVPAPAGIA
ncbi:DUF4956 domain-containing protein [Arthrobacter ginkgonis]|uniref:DUF4956 domain-containing protein n=1 Tax=Arthrobacter ginkgonis TaxID=1630594 RepID=A0ABP7D778_9MICC